MADMWGNVVVCMCVSVFVCACICTSFCVCRLRCFSCYANEKIKFISRCRKMESNDKTQNCCRVAHEVKQK